MRGVWYFGLHQHGDILREWQIGLILKRPHTHTHRCQSPCWCPLKGTTQGHLLVHSLKFVHHCAFFNSPYFGSKWPPWAPWISMSRVPGFFNLVWFRCMTRAVRMGWKKGRWGWGRCTSQLLLAEAFTSTFKRDVYIIFEKCEKLFLGTKASFSAALAGKIMVVLISQSMNCVSALTFTNKPKWKTMTAEWRCFALEAF